MGFTKPKHAPCSVTLTKEQVSALRVIPMFGARDATPTRKLQFVDEPKNITVYRKQKFTEKYSTRPGKSVIRI